MNEESMNRLIGQVEATWDINDKEKTQHSIDLAVAELGNGFKRLLSKNQYVSSDSIWNQIDDASAEAQSEIAIVDDESEMQDQENSLDDLQTKEREVEGTDVPLWRCKYNLLSAHPVSCDEFTELMNSYNWLLQHQ